MKCCLLMNTAYSYEYEIYSPIFYLKHIKTGVPMITIRTVREKLNEEILGKERLRTPAKMTE